MLFNINYLLFLLRGGGGILKNKSVFSQNYFTSKHCGLVNMYILIVVRAYLSNVKLKDGNGVVSTMTPDHNAASLQLQPPIRCPAIGNSQPFIAPSHR